MCHPDCKDPYWDFWIQEKITQQEANEMKALALKKVGSYITIPKRQFIGRSAEVDKVIQEQVDAYIITPLKAAMERRMKRKMKKEAVPKAGQPLLLFCKSVEMRPCHVSA